MSPSLASSPTHAVKTTLDASGSGLPTGHTIGSQMQSPLSSRSSSSAASSFNDDDDTVLSHLDPPDCPSSEACFSSRRASTGSRTKHGLGNTARPHRIVHMHLPNLSPSQGDVMRFTSLGETTIVLSSARAVSDLLEARGAIYSDRPSTTMAGELVGWDKGLGYARLVPSTPPSFPSASTPYPIHSDARFRALRRIFHASIGPKACLGRDLIAMQEGARTRVLWRMLKTCERAPRGCDFGEDVRQSTGGLILLLTYGHKVDWETDDPLVKIVNDAMDGFSRASDPGAYWVDRWPFRTSVSSSNLCGANVAAAVKYVPTWFPGARFHRDAAKMRADRRKLYQVPFATVRSQLEDGTALPSMISTFLSPQRTAGNGSEREAEEELVQAAAASLYSGGAETTPSSLLSFLLAMLLFPRVQDRAQAELDRVLGPPSSDLDVRLPSLEDRADLPYVDALVKEIWRWNPSVPLGLAHRMTVDDVYRGWHIEKGATLYVNAWAILHDDAVFPDPSAFRPERYLDSDGKLKDLRRAEDPAWIAFGYGRRHVVCSTYPKAGTHAMCRVCPGASLADTSVFLYVASILYTYRALKAVDGDGKVIEPVVDYEGFISHPRPFPCRLVPRSKAAEALVRHAAAEYETI
ncbi:cytochrome P450 [Amylostereum chailletii]|nr:cytochrome P450 [Amylostereum chailletii]